MRRSLAIPAAAAVAALALTGIGAPAFAVDSPVINEFSANTAGTDVEYIELLAEPNAVLSDYRVLHIEGDAPSQGVVDSVIDFPAADATGRSLKNLTANTLENASISLLLVTGAFPTVGTDIDVDNDGVIDASFGLTVVDAVAINDGGAGDLTYAGAATLTPSYDGLPFTPGAGSRIPDGTDTDTLADWARNDFDLVGIPSFAGSPVVGEAINTPGVANALFVPSGPPAGAADCLGESLAIGAVQGTAAASTLVGQTVRVEGVVTATFQGTGGLSGYNIQDAGDGNAATSDGIFIFAPGGETVAVGNVVNVAGSVVEFASAGGSATQIEVADIEVCETVATVPAPIAVTLPATNEVRESLEGMLVTFPQDLAILEQFEFARYGTVDVGVARQMTPTAVAEPGAPANAVAAQNLLERITLDDGKGFQNTDPLRHPNGEPFSLTNGFRGGDLLTNITGVLDYRLGGWSVQPTQGAQYTVANPRPAVPTVGGEVTVASFNVLNYFTTLGSRGANTAAEFDRQEAKIVTALAELDADIVGLIEIENNGTAVAALVEALNAVVGAGTYTHIDTGVLGADAITNALIYKPARVEPLGSFAALTNAIDARFLDINRPALTQTFAEVGGSEPVTVVVNHLKSKGSDCNAQGDPDTGSGAGNCNIVRTQAALALADWLATDPTDQGAGRELIIGDLNSYDKEDPIDALRAAEMTDLLFEFEGENAYSYVFDGQLGYLDYALAGADIVEDVTGAAVWRINADEVPALDYNTEFKTAGQVDAFFSPNAFRSSDHDPVLVGLDLTLPDTIAPTITVSADPSRIFPPNNKNRTVTITIDAADETSDVEVELVSAVASGSKKASIAQTSDTTFTVKAAIGAVYTITYSATDAAGNTATATAVVRVGP